MNLTLEAQPKVNIKNKLSIGMQFLSGIEGYLERERERNSTTKNENRIDATEQCRINHVCDTRLAGNF